MVILNIDGRLVEAGVTRPIGIDLFSGVGGLSLGFEQAGFDIKAAVEVDPVHCAAHKFNFPDCKIIPRSVLGLAGSEIRQLSGIDDQEIDVVFGGAPCQGFSLIGQRAMDDPRNQLVKEFVRIVGELRPFYFVFENVKGLTVGKHRKFLEEIIEAFETVGYDILSPWKVLNAADYGAPQDRERVILIGGRKGLALPTYPDTVLQGERPTVHDALADLPDAEQFDELLDTDEVPVGSWGETSAYARKLRGLENTVWEFGYDREWNRDLLTSSMRTNHSDISRRRFQETLPGSVEPISRFFKLPPDGVSNTLRAGTDSARGAFTSPRPIHYKFPRCITVREMARLHGFPDWFRFHETKWHGARQIGNAVPPPLAMAVATSIVKILGIEPKKPQKVLRLDQFDLLRMNLAQAAKYFGIDVPIGRRDRKSGARKRSQLEIEAERLSAG